MRRVLWIAGFAAPAGLLVFQLLNPVHSRFHHLVMLLAVVGLLTGIGVLLRRRWWCVLSLPVLLVGAYFLPGREIDRGRLAERYVQEMVALEGVEYVWGGESARGIDCSGLPRLALRKALLAEGLTGEPLRVWTSLWWQDLSAKAMGEGYGGFTYPLGVRGKLQTLGTDALKPGDLAVTDNGVHVMIYLGGSRWIQADPAPGRVVIGDPAVDQSGWFVSGVSLHRWAILKSQASDEPVGR